MWHREDPKVQTRVGPNVVLVTGGYGYIGSHTVVQLLETGHAVVVVDDLSNSKQAVGARIDAITGMPHAMERFDLRDQTQLHAVFAEHHVTSVLHFAGLKAVGDSVVDPLTYYETNLEATMSLLRVMHAHDVRRLVFSSSATVYGATSRPPMSEDMPRSATNPYGRTKLMIEQILEDLAATDQGWQIAALRYFNPVGAHPSGLIGEDPRGAPTNLLPYVSQVAIGRRERLRVFGDDYDTPDGTGLRDYIHVEDLAAGHLAALDRLHRTDDGFRAWNLGTGRPTSVFELVHAFERASRRVVEFEVTGRRPGDVASSYADPSRANAELGWHATRSIEDMCADAWRWQSQNPTGYPDAEPVTVEGVA